MPMSWTPENDRLLLLKLVETHKISVQPQLIADAWPSNGDERPTKRAITERFVKLRQLAGIKASIVSTPGKARPRTSKYNTSVNATPSSSAKKRKMNKKKDISDESDADGYLTDQDTPTARRKAPSGRASTAKSGDRGGMHANDGDLDNDVDAAPSTPVRVKKEPASDDVFSSPKFKDDARRAKELNAHINGNAGSFSTSPGASFGSGFDFSGYGIPTPGDTRQNSFADTLAGMDGGNDNLGFNAFNQHGFGSGAGTSMDMGMSNNDFVFVDNMDVMGFPVNTMPMHANHLNLVEETSNMHLSPSRDFAISQSSAHAGGPVLSEPFIGRPSLGSRDTSSFGYRARSSRHASKAATEGIGAFIQHQKEQDNELGEKSSEEDSQASEFQASDFE